jgi:hypothetical protein
MFRFSYILHTSNSWQLKILQISFAANLHDSQQRNWNGAESSTVLSEQDPYEYLRLRFRGLWLRPW